jgi:hypothetical protein
LKRVQGDKVQHFFACRKSVARFMLPDAQYQIGNVGQGLSLAIYDVSGRVVKSFNPASSIKCCVVWW